MSTSTVRYLCPTSLAPPNRETPGTFHAASKRVAGLQYKYSYAPEALYCTSMYVSSSESSDASIPVKLSCVGLSEVSPHPPLPPSVPPTRPEIIINGTEQAASTLIMAIDYPIERLMYICTSYTATPLPHTRGRLQRSINGLTPVINLFSSALLNALVLEPNLLSFTHTF